MSINIFLGAPGTGKGTISNKFKEKGFKHFSTGDMFRYNIKNETPLGLKVKSIIDAGKLVDDETTFALITDTLEKDSNLANDNIILDGFPRTVNQAEMLNKWLEEKGLKVNSVINFDAPENVILDRLTGRRMCPNVCKSYHMIFMPPQTEGKCDVCNTDLYQREDDMIDAVKVRLDAYEKQTLPLVKWYESRNELSSIDASQSIDEIVKQAMEIIS